MVVKSAATRKAAPRTMLAETLRARLSSVPEHLPKYVRFGDALRGMIDQGAWPAGACLPTEVDLAAHSGFSLGTVQRGIGLLVDQGRLKRVRGRGTFVTETPRLLARPFMHLLFVGDDGAFLPIRTGPAIRALIRKQGAWSAVLGQQGNNIFRVDRVVRVADEFRVLSRFYINADRFPWFTRLSDDELTHSNYKLLLQRELNLPEIAFDQTLTFGSLPREAAQSIGVRGESTGCALRVAARTRDGDALYFHEMFFPPNERALQLPRISLFPRRGSP